MGPRGASVLRLRSETLGCRPDPVEGRRTGYSLALQVGFLAGELLCLFGNTLPFGRQGRCQLFLLAIVLRLARSASRVWRRAARLWRLTS